MPGDNRLEFTDEELKAVRSLERLARRWPASLGLHAGTGLQVVKLTADGSFPDSEGGTALTYPVSGIPSDGGDPDWR